jgi:hypothetical protein
MQERDEAVRLAETRAVQQQKAADALRSEVAEAAASGDDLRTMVLACMPPAFRVQGVVFNIQSQVRSMVPLSYTCFVVSQQRELPRAGS